MLDAFGPLELGHAQRGEVRLHLGQRERLTVDDDVRAGALAQPRIGHGDDGRGDHAGVAEHQQLHLLGVDLLAAAVDQVLDAALDGDAALAVDRRDRGEVAGAVEAVGGEGARVVLRRVEVAAQRVRPAAAQLPHLPVGHLGLGAGFEHADLVVRRERGADGGGAGAAGGPGTGGEEQALAHAEELPRPQAAAFEVVEQRGRHLRPRQHHLRQRRRRGREPGVGHRAEVAVAEQHVGGPLPGHQRQRRVEVGGAEHQARADAVRGVDGADDARVVDDRDQVRDAAVRALAIAGFDDRVGAGRRRSRARRRVRAGGAPRPFSSCRAWCSRPWRPWRWARARAGGAARSPWGWGGSGCARSASRGVKYPPRPPRWWRRPGASPRSAPCWGLRSSALSC